MFREEIEMTLECAVKVRKHLVRILEKDTDSALEARLKYVNGLIKEANSMRNKVQTA